MLSEKWMVFKYLVASSEFKWEVIEAKLAAMSVVMTTADMKEDMKAVEMNIVIMTIVPDLLE